MQTGNECARPLSLVLVTTRTLLTHLLALLSKLATAFLLAEVDRVVRYDHR